MTALQYVFHQCPAALMFKWMLHPVIKMQLLTLDDCDKLATELVKLVGLREESSSLFVLLPSGYLLCVSVRECRYVFLNFT